MPGCLVPGCTSSYKSNVERVHFFSVPKDENLKKQWHIAIKRPNTLVSKKQVVGDKHFLAGDIIRIRQLLSPEGEVVGVSPYRRPRLALGAVPSLFPWTAVESSNDDMKNVRDANPEASEVCLVPDKSNTPEDQVDLVVSTFPVNIDTVDRLEELEVGKSSEVCLYTETAANITNNLASIEPLVTLSELKSIYSQKSPTESVKIIETLRKKLNEAVKIDNFEDNYFTINHDHSYNESQTLDCILYYATEVVVSRIYKSTTCEQCQKGIRDCSVHLSDDDSLMVNIKSDQTFFHPNQSFYLFIKKLEAIFQKHCESVHVFEDVMTEVISSNILRFPCPEHAGELLLSAINYYIRLRMQQYTSQMNKSNKKQNQLKKKQAKFCSN